MFQPTVHPRCVQIAEHSVTAPAMSRYAATFDMPRRSTAPDPRTMASADDTSPGVSQSLYCQLVFAFSRVNSPAASSVLREGS